MLHNTLSSADAHERVLNALASVGLNASAYHSYPGQLSGGMGQRAMLAIALVNNPRVLIADEPTSALDAKLRNQILELIVEQTEQRKMSLLLISHDLPLVAEHCHRVLVMYQGSWSIKVWPLICPIQPTLIPTRYGLAARMPIPMAPICQYWIAA